MRDIYTRYALIVASILFLTTAWEFFVEDYVIFQSIQESFDDKMENIATASIFSVLALILPFYMTTKSEKTKKHLVIEREKLIGELQKNIDAMKKLEGIIPICSYCKKIRDEQGAWSKLEIYLQNHSEAAFSHGVCPQCLSSTFSNIDRLSGL